MDVDDVFAATIASRYRIERKLGEGGMAVVYLARDARHGRPVALKVLRPELATTLGAERFLREITIAARLVHPNILPLHDSGEAAGQLYYVMPYVEGATLRQRLDREKQLPLEDVADITSQIAAALDYAHAHDVVHRDVKPDNVLLVDGRVLVADFGLARALTSAASTPLTRTGTVVGTPAYMSPEQCAPGEAVDGRSDVYALACMAFEMIAGVTPFRGATAQAMIAHQISGDPPSVCAERARCPQAVDAVLKRGLAKSPADRYQRAGEFAGALGAAVRGGSNASPLPATVRAASRRRRRRWIPAGILALAIAAGGWLMSDRRLRASPALDRRTYAVFPFRHVGAASNAWLDGDGCARLLHDAMARWEGVHLVDDMRIGDLWARRPPHTVDDALRAAEDLHAGELAWGEVVSIGDSLEIRVVAYDVAHGDGAAREFRMRVSRNATQMDSVFAALADSIVIGGTGLRGASAIGTHNLAALIQFLDGREALDRFDLRLAENRFGAAAETDENFAQAHLWAARTRAWRGNAEPSAWLGDATRAVALSASLSSRDAAHAAALLDLANGHAPQACRRYRALTVSDSTDFAAWLGLGDCNAEDDGVQRDNRSPTGYSFTGSYYTAVKAYRRALALVPSFHQAERGLAFQRLSGRVLITEESHLRRGRGVDPDTQSFVALPSFVSDTLAFIPVTLAQARKFSIRSLSEPLAVAWAARTSRDLMAEWVRAFPADADAHAAYANALETTSAVTGSVEDLSAALAEARFGATRANSPDVSTFRRVVVLRLLLKMDSTAAARRLADSLLSDRASPSPYAAGYLANVAELTGRPSRAASLLASAAASDEHVPFAGPDGRRAALPPDLMTAALQLRAYASFDISSDSAHTLLARVRRLASSWTPLSQRPATLTMLLATPIIVAGDVLGPLPRDVTADRNELLGMRIALIDGNTAEARRAGAQFGALVQGYTPGTIGIDRLVAYAGMLLSLRDTAAATRELDAALTSLPRARTILLEVTPQAAAVGRAMLLRATLAVRAGDSVTAKRWGSRVAMLWSDGDPEVRAQLAGLARAAGGAF